MNLTSVFLSSTSKDLREYRDAAYEALHKLEGYHCVRMEDFGSADQESDEFCRERVAECDLFIGIVGHCYGSEHPASHESYTEREYNVAVDLGKPRLMFIAPATFPLPANLIEPDAKRAKQDAFRKRISKDRLRKEFTSPEGLAAQVSQSIYNWKLRQSSKLKAEVDKELRLTTVEIRKLTERQARVAELSQQAIDISARLEELRSRTQQLQAQRAATSVHLAISAANHVQVPTGRIIIVRHNNRYGAFQAIDQASDPREPSIRYAWWYQPNGSNVFTQPPAQGGFAEAICHRVGPNEHHDAFLNIGPVRLLWSNGGNGNGYVYYGPSSTPSPDYHIEITNQIDIAKIDARTLTQKYVARRFSAYSPTVTATTPPASK